MVKQAFKVLFIFVLPFGGCVADYRVVGGFEEFNEVFAGNLSHNSTTGRGAVTLQSQSSHLFCQGATYEDVSAIQIGCKGRNGKASVACTDGRRLIFDWRLETCGTGVGRGYDQTGAALSFEFLTKDESANKAVRQLMQGGTEKPALPVFEIGAEPIRKMAR